MHRKREPLRPEGHAVGYASGVTVDIRTEFTDLVSEIEAEMRLVLGERDGPTQPLYEMLAYHLGLDEPDRPRGKRIRPLLGLLVYQALTEDYRTALPGAAAVELGHNFSLVHDDIEDGDRERRHRPTLWAIWGVPMAINAGDALFALSRLALYRLLEADVPEKQVLDLMRVYDETCLALCEGQFLDISFERRDDVTVDEYVGMIGKKTAALLGASAQAGAILAGKEPEIVEAFRGFGFHLGLAFQVADDLKGTFWASAASGKTMAGDIRKRKKTLPVVWAMEHATEPDLSRLREIYVPRLRATDGTLAPEAEPMMTDAEVTEVVAILERCGAHEEARRAAERYRDEALRSIEGLPIPAPRRAELVALVESSISI
jgi:geranylgeranyl diphosphate synthase type I